MGRMDPGIDLFRVLPAVAIRLVRRGYRGDLRAEGRHAADPITSPRTPAQDPRTSFRHPQVETGHVPILQRPNPRRSRQRETPGHYTGRVLAAKGGPLDERDWDCIYVEGSSSWDEVQKSRADLRLTDTQYREVSRGIDARLSRLGNGAAFFPDVIE
jgi:hypothetical protein